MKRKTTVNLGNLLLSLSEVTDLANPSISQHQHRTAFLAWEIGKALDLPIADLKPIYTAALLHDIGAITVEEKDDLHAFRTEDTDLHCIRGELLLQRVPRFAPMAKIVRYHHTEWRALRDQDDAPHVLGSQIVLLADRIEREIDRSKYILHQDRDIVDRIAALGEAAVHPRVSKAFRAIAGREELWLDVASPRLYPLLLHEGPLEDVDIDLDAIRNVADLFRDVIDFKSPFTATHTSGVDACARKLATLFGLTENEIRLLRIAGNLHDIGKMIVPNSILDKPGKLTKDEFAIIRCHTYYSYYVIRTIGGLQQIAEWAAYHHEKLDGSGYPFHCRADEIGVGSRIMAVADIFTAVSEDRPYRQGMTKDEISATLRAMSAKGHIDERIVELLLDHLDDVTAYVRGEQVAARDFYQNRFARASDTTVAERGADG